MKLIRFGLGVELWHRGGGNVAGKDGKDEHLGWKAEAGIRFCSYNLCCLKPTYVGHWQKIVDIPWRAVKICLRPEKY